MKYLSTNSISKEGINFIKTIVDKANCIFNETPQQNDLGIDAQIEFIKNEIPVNSLVALQIKSGNSFYDDKKHVCTLSVGGHYDYWKNYPMDVIGIVYIPQMHKAYWIDIKEYFEEKGKVSKIKIHPNRINEFNENTFQNIILEHYSNQTPLVSYAEVLDFLNSDIEQEFTIGFRSGFVYYSNKNEFWNLLVNYLFNKSKESISPLMLYSLSFATQGVDVFYSSKHKYTDENLKYAKMLLSKIDKDNIIKLLSMFDSETIIARGNIGSSIESIISNADKADEKLLDIIYTKGLDLELRQHAVAIYANLDVVNLLNKLEKIEKENFELDMSLTIDSVRRYGRVYFYM